ncbi:uncharacterized protein LOC119586050 [Penaeus monodon]|uniref:uncharacterized protein LOC119586050 n=1 Tax=Penaeus monodon TaxID=6687 RepID=UPI0018A72F5C|nr:uncharacterized protein LOC119586050 [Penaeus monodon]
MQNLFLLKALDIQDMAGSFVVLSSGFVFGGFLLVMECYFRFRRVEKEPAPKPRGRTEDPQLTVDEISEKDLKTLSDTETSSSSVNRPRPKEMSQTLKDPEGGVKDQVSLYSHLLKSGHE